MRKLLVIPLLAALAVGCGGPKTTDLTPGANRETIEDMPADMMVDMAIADMAPDMPEEMDMLMYPDAEMFACAYPSSDPMCPMGEFGPGAYITSFEIVNDNTCCRDFDDDGMLENFIGSQILPSAEMLSGVIACRSVGLARCWINLAVRSVGCVMFSTTSHV